METKDQLAEMLKATKEMETRLEAAEKKAADYDKLRENAVASGDFRPSGNSSNSDEVKCLRYFGVPNAQKLIEVNVGHPNFEHVPQELKHMVLSLKQDVDVARMTAQICRGGQLDRSAKSDARDFVPGTVGSVLDTYYGKNVLAPKLKAFGTGTANEGAEWVPTAVSSSYIEEYELSREVAKMFGSLSMPSNPYDLPVQTDPLTARIQGEKATISSANFKTDKISFDATKLAEFTCLPEELNEDSAPNILAAARREVVESSGRAIETAIISGDTAVTHQDSDVTAADDARKAWDGLRKLAIGNGATIDFLSAATTVAKVRTMRTAMDKFGVNTRELAWIMSPKVYNQFLGFDEVSTVEKFGPMASILKGALSALDGIPIVISEFARDDLNASGVYDGVTTTQSGLLLANVTRFMLGVRRPIRVRAVPNPTPPNDEWMLVSWWRGDFQGHVQSASESSVVYGINIA